MQGVVSRTESEVQAFSESFIRRKGAEKFLEMLEYVERDILRFREDNSSQTTINRSIVDFAMLFGLGIGMASGLYRCVREDLTREQED